MTARGTFDVKLIPQAADGDAAGPFQRLLLDKRVHGDLEGTSRGQMMAARTAVENSAAYVALELVNGTLDGRRGSFVMLHRGTMRGGAKTLDVDIVPDSGTEELTGIGGRMAIIIEGGAHRYELEYRLPPRG